MCPAPGMSGLGFMTVADSRVALGMSFNLGTSAARPNASSAHPWRGGSTELLSRCEML